MTEMYRANWRPFIIGVAAINALRFLLTAHNAFQDVHVDNTQNVPTLAAISTALGAMYAITAVIDIFGVVSASLQRLNFIRIYAHLAFISAFLVTVAGVMATFTYFMFAEDLVKECASLAAEGKLDAKSLFRGAPWPAIRTLSGDAAKAKCLNAWSDEAFSQVLAVFFFSLIPSLVYFCLAYTYYRQVTDPLHPASLCRHPHGRGSAIRMEAYPGGSSSPMYHAYSDGHPVTLASSLGSKRPSAQDPSPQKKTATSKTPAKSAKSAKSRPTALTATSKPQASPRSFAPSFVIDSASTYTMSPGPPSFGPKVGISYPPYNGHLAGYDEPGFM